MEYATLREKIAAEKTQRLAKYAQFVRIVSDADDAGMQAAKNCVPRPMTVYTPKFMSNEVDSTKTVYHVPEGMCGFAWVSLTKGNSSFARWAKEHAGFRKSYSEGVQLWISDFNQSVERKEAYARAYAGVLNQYKDITGTEAYAGSRLD